MWLVLCRPTMSAQLYGEKVCRPTMALFGTAGTSSASLKRVAARSSPLRFSSAQFKDLHFALQALGERASDARRSAGFFPLIVFKRCHSCPKHGRCQLSYMVKKLLLLQHTYIIVSCSVLTHRWIAKTSMFISVLVGKRHILFVFRHICC